MYCGNSTTDIGIDSAIDSGHAIHQPRNAYSGLTSKLLRRRSSSGGGPALSPTLPQHNILDVARAVSYSSASVRSKCALIGRRLSTTIYISHDAFHT